MSHNLICYRFHNTVNSWTVILHHEKEKYISSYVLHVFHSYMGKKDINKQIYQNLKGMVAWGWTRKTLQSSLFGDNHSSLLFVHTCQNTILYNLQQMITDYEHERDVS